MIVTVTFINTRIISTNFLMKDYRIACLVCDFANLHFAGHIMVMALFMYVFVRLLVCLRFELGTNWSPDLEILVDTMKRFTPLNHPKCSSNSSERSYSYSVLRKNLHTLYASRFTFYASQVTKKMCLSQIYMGRKISWDRQVLLPLVLLFIGELWRRLFMRGECKRKTIFIWQFFPFLNKFEVCFRKRRDLF